MRFSKKIAALSFTSTQHPAEDWLSTSSFIHEGVEVLVGALSDGCSENVYDRNYQPEFGADWLSQQFVQEAEALYRQGLRNKELGTQIVLHLVAEMLEYTPRSTRSTWHKTGTSGYWDELATTILGFVADDEHILFVLGGDGYVLLGKTLTELKSHGRYPISMATLPQDLWRKLVPGFFAIETAPLESMGTFAIASDGLTETMGALVESWSHAPQANPLELQMALVGERLTRRQRRDDITLIALSISKADA